MNCCEISLYNKFDSKEERVWISILKVRLLIRGGTLEAEKIAGQYCITRFRERGIGALPHGQPRQITVPEFLKKHQNITGD
jgi:hypothetical protein